MVQIHNSDLFKELRDGTKSQQLRDGVLPSQLAEKVVPVMEVNPKLLRRCEIVRTNAASNATTATIYTTPTDKDFYLCGASLSVIKDVTSTSVVSAIAAPVGGGTTDTRRILVISEISVTIQNGSVATSFQTPIKIDRGVTIVVTNSTNVGNIRADGCIWGYLVENINA
jgi:hypothetical protein